MWPGLQCRSPSFLSKLVAMYGFLQSGFAFVPPMPSGFETELLLAGGRVPDGRPRFRVVHGRKALDWNGELKYVWGCDDGWNCWVLEEAVPPSFFGPREDWELQNLERPYPASGDYVIVEPLISPLIQGGHAVPLNDGRVITRARFLRKAREEMPTNDWGIKQMLRDNAARKRVEQERLKAAQADQAEGEWERVQGKKEVMEAALTREHTKPEYVKVKSNATSITE